MGSTTTLASHASLSQSISSYPSGENHSIGQESILNSARLVSAFQRAIYTCFSAQAFFPASSSEDKNQSIVSLYHWSELASSQVFSIISAKNSSTKASLIFFFLQNIIT